MMLTSPQLIGIVELRNQDMPIGVTAVRVTESAPSDGTCEPRKTGSG
jgi:hypothetical protein